MLENVCFVRAGLGVKVLKLPEVELTRFLLII